MTAIGSTPGTLGAAGPPAGGSLVGPASVTPTVNLGGVRDNVKKHTEEGNPGGKGSEAYCVIAAGDIAGDFPKDILGLSSNTSTKPTLTAVTATVGSIALRSSPQNSSTSNLKGPLHPCAFSKAPYLVPRGIPTTLGSSPFALKFIPYRPNSLVPPHPSK